MAFDLSVVDRLAELLNEEGINHVPVLQKVLNSQNIQFITLVLVSAGDKGEDIFPYYFQEILFESTVEDYSIKKNVEMLNFCATHKDKFFNVFQ